MIQSFPGDSSSKIPGKGKDISKPSKPSNLEPESISLPLKKNSPKDPKLTLQSKPSRKPRQTKKPSFPIPETLQELELQNQTEIDSNIEQVLSLVGSDDINVDKLIDEKKDKKDLESNPILETPKPTEIPKDQKIQETQQLQETQEVFEPELEEQIKELQEETNRLSLALERNEKLEFTRDEAVFV
jgi:hypothetical protein